MSVGEKYPEDFFHPLCFGGMPQARLPLLSPLSLRLIVNVPDNRWREYRSVPIVCQRVGYVITPSAVNNKRGQPTLALACLRCLFL